MRLLLISLICSLSGLSSPVSAQETHSLPPVLERILTDAGTLQRRGVIPVLVMDLDETTVDSTPRRAAAYRRAANALCPAASAEKDGWACRRLRHLTTETMHGLTNDYSVAELFAKLGITDAPIAPRIEAESLKIYLSGFGLELDEALPGATDFVREFRRRSGRIFFVSARSKEAQLPGTLQSLHALGLFGDSADERDVILRPEGMPSLEFKQRTFAWIRDQESVSFRVIGVFENEPENMNALLDAFPDARSVFIERAWMRAVPVRTESAQGPVVHLQDYL